MSTYGTFMTSPRLGPAQERAHARDKEDLIMRFHVNYDQAGKASWWLYA